MEACNLQHKELLFQIVSQLALGNLLTFPLCINIFENIS